MSNSLVHARSGLAVKVAIPQHVDIYAKMNESTRKDFAASKSRASKAELAALRNLMALDETA